MMPQTRDLLIVSRERIDLYDDLRTSSPASLEIRVDARVGDRRRVVPGAVADDRRRRDRRALDLSEQLQTLGWAIVPAARAGELVCAVCRTPIQPSDGYYTRHDRSYHADCYPHRSPPSPA